MENRSIGGQEWLERNSLRSYPLVEDSVAILSNGNDLPRNLLADAFVVVPTTYGQVSVSSVFFTAMTATVTISVSVPEAPTATVGYATAVLGVSEPGVAIPLTGPDGTCCGSITFGDILLSSTGMGFSLLAGMHDLEVSAPLEARCCIFAGKPIISRIVGRYGGEGVLGAVGLSLSEELEATVSSANDGGDVMTTLTIGLKSPEDFLPRCMPKTEEEDCRCDGVIRSINGVTGDSVDSNITILVQSNGFGNSPEISTDLGTQAINLILEVPGNELCIRTPVIPDEFGRLGPNFDEDCPPRKGYGGLIWSGPQCDNPPQSVPIN